MAIVLTGSRTVFAGSMPEIPKPADPNFTISTFVTHSAKWGDTYSFQLNLNPLHRLLVSQFNNAAGGDVQTDLPNVLTAITGAWSYKGTRTLKGTAKVPFVKDFGGGDPKSGRGFVTVVANNDGGKIPTDHVLRPNTVRGKANVDHATIGLLPGNFIACVVSEAFTRTIFIMRVDNFAPITLKELEAANNLSFKKIPEGAYADNSTVSDLMFVNLSLVGVGIIVPDRTNPNGGFVMNDGVVPEVSHINFRPLFDTLASAISTEQIAPIYTQAWFDPRIPATDPQRRAPHDFFDGQYEVVGYDLDTDPASMPLSETQAAEFMAALYENAADNRDIEWNILKQQAADKALPGQKPELPRSSTALPQMLALHTSDTDETVWVTIGSKGTEHNINRKAFTLPIPATFDDVWPLAIASERVIVGKFTNPAELREHILTNGRQITGEDTLRHKYFVDEGATHYIAYPITRVA